MRSAIRAWSRRASPAALLLAAAAAAQPIESSTPTAVLSIEEAVSVAVADNPQVRSAKAQYEAALHQIDQAYTPQDPQLGWSDNNYEGGFKDAASKSLSLSDSFQFPGKAWLQGDEAHRSAEIARLTYLAAVRDARAQAETVYYQLLLDSASVGIAIENTDSFSQVLRVVEVAYATNQAAQSDLVNAELAVTQSSQSVWTSQTAEENDEAALNLAMGLPAETPVKPVSSMELVPVPMGLEQMKERAQALRQEILEAALTEKNAHTARTLAWMELLPDYSLSWAKTSYAPNGTQPAYDFTRASDYTAAISFNLPVFFWFHQKEDVVSADRLLESARQNRRLVELQTEASVVELYRSTMLAFRVAELNKELLIPLALQDFRVALVAYQSKKVDFLTLSSALQGIYSARINYLTAANQYLAGKVALEQAIGAPFQ